MRKTLGPLECLVREGDSGRCMVLLHGFGADAADLFPLADFLDPEGEWTFVCPNAPHEVPIGPAWTGRGWFPISLRDLEAGVDFTKIRPPGLDQSAEMVSSLLFELNAETLVLGGFSQGAMVAMDVTMTSPEDVSGLVLYSATMLDEPGWTKKAAGLRGKKFVQSHGTMDSVLPIAPAQKLYDLLKANGAEGSFLVFPGAHEIPMPVLKKSKEFLSSF